MCGGKITATLFWAMLWVIFENPSYGAARRLDSTNAAIAEDGWKRVVDRQGSSVLTPSRTEVSHDGEVVILKVDGLSARFWSATESRRGFPGHDPARDMNLTPGDCDKFPPTYRIIKKSLAAYSCVKGGKVNYYVAKYSNYGGVFLFSEYSSGNKDNYNSIISRMVSSMRQVKRLEFR
jgi:hypothetical protein